MTTHKRGNPQMFLQRLNSSVSSLPSIPQGEQVVNFELDSFQESDPDTPLKQHDDIFDIERQLSQWNAESILPKKKPWFKWLSVLVVATLAVVLLLNIFYRHITLSGKSNINNLMHNNGFPVQAFLNGTFQSQDAAFKFLSPPTMDDITKNKDEGLYITMERNSQDENVIVAKKLKDRDFSVLISNTRFDFNGANHELESIIVAYSLDYAILGTSIFKAHRHSSSALYWLYDINSGAIYPIKPNDSISPHPRLSFCHFSPNYNYLYFVHENDLYVQRIRDPNDVRRVSFDGSKTIINGRTDWVYEEELISDDVAVWWSPDDLKLTYARIDDTKVNSYEFPIFINGMQSTSKKEVKYPLPGMNNPELSLLYFDLTDNSSGKIESTNHEDKSLLYYAKWLDENNFLYKMSDRESKVLHTMIYNYPEKKAETLRTRDTTKYHGWIEKCKDIITIRNESNGASFLDVLPDANGYPHIFYFNSPKDKDPKQITKGEYEVKDLVVVDKEQNIVFFHSNYFHPMGQQLLSTSLVDEKEAGDEKHILINQEKYEYSKFILSPSGQFAIKQYLGPDIPETITGNTNHIIQTDNEDKNLISITKNEHIKDAIQRYNFPVTSYREMHLEDDVIINYIEIKPKNFDPKVLHPLLVYVYGGPGSETFTTKFSASLEESLSSNINAIVLKIEPRGTGGKGWKFRSWATEKLGFWEPRDLVTVTQNYIKENEGVIDEDKVAVWGWSYGGFVTLKTLEFDKGNTFKYAVSVAPVTNWKYYDSIYSERYLGLPLKTDAYEKVSRVKDYDSFGLSKRFLLIHGTADDNVHIQNTYDFVDNLNLQNVRNFDLHIFPDSDHSIMFHNAQRMVYEKIYYWIKNAFLGKFEHLQ